LIYCSYDYSGYGASTGKVSTPWIWFAFEVSLCFGNLVWASKLVPK